MKILAVALIIFILGYLEILNPIRNSVQYFFTPVQFGLKNFAWDIKSGVSFFNGLRTVRQENLNLLRENNDLKAAIVELKKSQEENALLKIQLELKNQTTFDKELILANVMGNPADLTGASILIDKGARHGIKKGSNIIEGSYLVGVVSEVSNERSLVSLITSPQVSATVRDIDVSEKTEGLAVGQYGTSIKMTRILPNEEIRVGDNIITSGKDGLFEPGLLIGKVIQVEEVPAEPLKSAYLETIIDVSSLEKVFVIIN